MLASAQGHLLDRAEGLLHARRCGQQVMKGLIRLRAEERLTGAELVHLPPGRRR